MSRQNELNIIHATSVEEYGNDGWFPETDVKHVHSVLWSRRDGKNDNGAYIVGHSQDGIIWFHDGMDRIAAVNEWRVRRYLYRGVNHRFEKLLRDYLGNGLIKIPDGARIINFGANIGEVALALTRKGAKVLAIEPDPNVLPALRANARGRLIDIAEVAAWKEDTQLTLYLASERADTSVIDNVGPQVQVPGRKIDTLLCERGVYDVYLIVGDAEGGEPEVLEGARETLKRTRYVSIRVSPERHGASSEGLCRDVLVRAGFEIVSCENETLIGRNVLIVDRS